MGLLIVAEARPADGDRLADASLEELMNVEISSFSRKQQKLRQTAGAVFVITSDDIRRSGATLLPEVLRLAPGLHVARIDSTKWAISARGFANRLSNKMLVLIDGRSVYNTIYGGVFWDQHDLPLEEVERIEVVRGPGATSWGANAVNGVINIITRRAADTQGLRVSALTGGEERAATSARWGGSVGKHLQYRVTGKAFRIDGLRPLPARGTNNDWDSGRVGLRVDWQISERDEVSVQADRHMTSGQQTIARVQLTGPGAESLVAPLTSHGGFASVRWQRKGERLDTALQAYVTNEWRGETLADATVRQTDLDFQQRYRWRRAHDLVWGLGYRDSRDRIVAGRVSFTPASQHDALYSSFLQDEIALIPDRLIFTIGTKFLHHNHSGPAIQPGVRLLWTPGRYTSWWASATRAVRLPTHYDRGITAHFSDALLPVRGTLRGSPLVDSESVRAYETGVRRQMAKRVTVDLAAFANDYRDVLQAPLGSAMFRGGQLHLEAIYANERQTRSHGVETVAQWEIHPGWRASVNHSWYGSRHAVPDATKVVPFVGDPQGRDPAHTFQVRFSGDLSRRMSFDLLAYRQSTLVLYQVPAYLRLDARWSWRLRPEVELSAGLRNALQAAHVEHVSEDYVRSAVRRTAYVRMDWTWGGR